jgi:hypothetical protein
VDWLDLLLSAAPTAVTTAPVDVCSPGVPLSSWKGPMPPGVGQLEQAGLEVRSPRSPSKLP